MSDEKSKVSRGAFLKNCAKATASLIFAGKMSAKADASGNPSPPPQSPLPFALEEEGRFETGLQKLAGIAVDSQGRIHAAGEKGVGIFTATGKSEREIPTSLPATCVAVGADGMIYVGHRGMLEKFQPDGRLKWAWGGADAENGQQQARVYYTSLALDGDFLYAADAGARSLKRFSVDGDFVDEISGFVIPSPFFDCAADGKGNLTVANTGKHRIERYDRNGRLLDHWGAFGAEPQNFCGCCNPTSFALFPDGRIATTEKGIPRLKVYAPDHRMIAHLGSEAFPDGVAGMRLAIDSRQRILLAEPKKSEIRIYRLASGKGGNAFDPRNGTTVLSGQIWQAKS